MDKSIAAHLIDQTQTDKNNNTKHFFVIADFYRFNYISMLFINGTVALVCQYT